LSLCVCVFCTFLPLLSVLSTVRVDAEINRIAQLSAKSFL
jgi:hypothetical protein